MKTKNFDRYSNNINIVKNGQDIFTQALSAVNGQHNGTSIFIPHVCNNINLFGAGFAAQVADKFPTVKDNFHLLGQKSKLGYVQNVLVTENKSYGHRLYICNMIAQNGVKGPKNNRPLNYGALCYCMNDIKNFIVHLKKNGDINKVQIYAPKFGSGLAGGNWNFITNLIEDIWSNIEVYIYLPPTNY